MYNGVSDFVKWNVVNLYWTRIDSFDDLEGEVGWFESYVDWDVVVCVVVPCVRYGVGDVPADLVSDGRVNSGASRSVHTLVRALAVEGGWRSVGKLSSEIEGKSFLDGQLYGVRIFWVIVEVADKKVCTR